MSCKKEEAPKAPEAEKETAAKPAETPVMEAKNDPIQLDMFVQDEANESDTDVLAGGEKFFVVQQSLSNGVIALFIADNHNYDSLISFISSDAAKFLGGSTFAKKAQARITQILLDSGNTLKTKVCDEDSVKERRRVLITKGLTKGTLILFKPAENTWDVYMNDNMSGGFFDGYEVTSIKMDNNGLVEQVMLSKFLRSSITIEENQNVNSNAPVSSREDVFLLMAQESSAQKSIIDLEQYIGILESIKGLDSKFSSCPIESSEE